MVNKSIKYLDRRLSVAARIGKPYRKRSLGETVAIYLLSVILTSVLLAFFIMFVGNDVFAVFKQENKIEIEIENALSENELTWRLCDEGVIECPLAFVIYAKAKGGISAQSGSYSFTGKDDYGEIIDILSRT